MLLYQKSWWKKESARMDLSDWVNFSDRKLILAHRKIEGGQDDKVENRQERKEDCTHESTLLDKGAKSEMRNREMTKRMHLNTSALFSPRIFFPNCFCSSSFFLIFHPLNSISLLICLFFLLINKNNDSVRKDVTKHFSKYCRFVEFYYRFPYKLIC